MTKKEVFDILSTKGIDKSGFLKTERGLRTKFPELYQEFIHFDFPKHISNLPFKQKLYHFLIDDFTIPTCKICGGKVGFVWGYKTYCSGKCAMRDDVVKEKLDQTKIERYGDRKYNNKEKLKETLHNRMDEEWNEIINKSKQTRYEKNNGYYFSEESLNKMKSTNMERYGCESYAQTDIFKKQYAKTCMKKYGTDNYAKTQECREKTLQTNLNRYGEIHYSCTDECKQKVAETMLRNNTFITSSLEDGIVEILKSLSINFIRQYRSELYPYKCDFYFPDYELFVEIQGYWSHWTHPFDENNEEDIKVVDFIKSKCGYRKNGKENLYFKVLYNWTIRDVKKRNIAKTNHLNYLELFDHCPQKCVDSILKMINELKNTQI